MDTINQRIDFLELRIKDWTENIKDVMRTHNETHAKQHELYSDNQRTVEQGLLIRLDGNEYKIKQLTDQVTSIKEVLPKLASIDRSDDIEERLRKLESTINAMESQNKSDEDNRATWLLVALTLFAAVLGLLSNLLGYIIS
jgi:chromosome segregation ATPase